MGQMDDAKAGFDWNDPTAREFATSRVQRPSGAEPRRCFYISMTEQDEGHGFVPSLVVENEPGYSPMRGNDRPAAPWYWGKTYEEANRVCDQVNRETFGLEPREALEIVMSSMRAGR